MRVMQNNGAPLRKSWQKKNTEQVIHLRKNQSLKDFLLSLNGTTDSTGEYQPPIAPERFHMIVDDLKRNYPKEVLDALDDDVTKRRLVEVVLKENGGLFKHDRSVAEYIVQETVGTGVFERILVNEDITDIGWNGKQLSAKTNNDYALIEGKELGINTETIERVISKYSAVNEKSFDSSNPIFDGMYKNIRISAVHVNNSPNGATLSLRIARPKLVLTQQSFHAIAPDCVHDFLKNIVQTRSNICICGETGCGKTELQKMMLGFIPPEERIIMIEDVQETHARELYPDKDIFSWVTSPKEDIAALVKTALRNFPKWIIVSETRGAEAYEMFNAVLSGHNIITTLHATDARTIPRRFVNMCSSGFKINEESVVNDIYTYFDFGIHLKSLNIDGNVVRYINEIVEFKQGGTATTLFKQQFDNGVFHCEYGELSPEFKTRMAEKYLDFDFPEDAPTERTPEEMEA